MSQYENVFKLEDPENWVCHIHAFSSTHSTMTIKASKRDGTKTVDILFRKVVYIAGFIGWGSANFRMFEDDAMIEFMGQSPLLNSKAGGWLPQTDTFRLFQVSLEDREDFILIANAGWCQDLKGNLISQAPPSWLDETLQDDAPESTSP